MALASCAKDSVKEVNNGHAIDFRVATQTRATETTTANLSTFYVTAIDAKGSSRKVLNFPAIDKIPLVTYLYI